MSKAQNLRTWQQGCLKELMDAFEAHRRALVVATPGAGKTTLALTFAGDLIRRDLVDHVHVVAPTRALKKHWQDASKEFGIFLGSRPNKSLRNGDLPFDVGGIVTTYKQVSTDPDAHGCCIANKKSLVILDEVHHAGDSLAWGEAITECASDARFVLSLSGTPFRNDRNAISLLKYSPEGVTIPDYVYSYTQAISDDVCRPIVFHTYNALIEYKRKGEEFSSTFSDDLPQDQMSVLLRHALHPEAGLIERMVRDANEELGSIRSRGVRWNDAAGLLVAMSQEHAIQCAEIVQRVTGEEPALIISDSESAEDDLQAFKHGIGKWVVAVRMISEGIDIPRLMVSVYASNVISTLFFRQFVGRTVRVRNKSMEEACSIFLPGDARLVAEAEKIEEEVRRFLQDAPPDKYRAVRGSVERAYHAMQDVPTISNISDDRVLFRHEYFSREELLEAENKKDIFPQGYRYDAAQLAYTIRRIKESL